MKVFEEWDRKEYPLPPTTERGPIGRDCLKQRKHAWKAALEWINQIIQQKKKDGYYLHAILYKVEDGIKDELKNE